MSFQLNSVVPWGRNLHEYFSMFNLNEENKNLKIAGFGDGPASFNCEATNLGFNVTSFDPIYQFSRKEIKTRIDEVREIVMKQMSENMDNYLWDTIHSLDELESVRMSAMTTFLNDYDKGHREKRYIYHELPNQLNFEENSFDIGLSSHFLLMYTSLGYDFHISAMNEMLRVCREIRIFPIVNLDAENSELISRIIDFYKKKYTIEIKNTTYAFQKGANKLLVIKK